MNQADTITLQDDLCQFTGTEEHHRWSILFRRYLLTDGAKYLADKAGAYWLMDAIASYFTEPKVRNEPFQVWNLKVNDDRSATLKMDDGNGNVKVTQVIEYTDFPLPEIKLYCAQNDDIYSVIMLPSEY
jgi:hypothetical protein